MPSSNNKFSLFDLDKFTVSTLLIFIDPASGFNNPIIFFKSTDLPDPEAPIMASDSPSYNQN